MAHAETASSHDPAPARRVGDAKLELLARIMYADVSVVGLFGAGVEGQYRPSPYYGLGGELMGFYVDSGGDPQYAPAGTLRLGFHGIAFVEGDLLTGFITPYARVGLGLGAYERRYGFDTPAKLNLVGQLSAGFALKGGPVVGRIWASPSFYGSSLLVTYGAGIGARF